jgi:hypothetical protein
VPSLDLWFAENKSLVDSVSGQNLITFTRASTGTFVDSDGVIRSAGNDVPRFDHNPLTGECLGLLVEEQRQNLLLNSATLSTQTVTVTAVAHTLSFYGTGTVTLTGTSTAGPLVGTGANARVSLTFTPTAGNLTLTVSGSVTNANLEIGSFSTSWIPTTGTAATRTADVVSISGTNFSSWYRQDEGTVFAEFHPQAAPFSAGRPVWAVTDNVSSRIDFRCRPTSKGGMLVQNSGVTQADTTGSNNYTTGRNASIASYATNNFASCLNGETPAVDTAGSVPSGMAEAFLGVSGYVSGNIRRLTYWGQRLPNNVLQSITL